MPRKARVKSPEFIYHIMCRSIPEILLFRDSSDKRYYLGLLKRYIDRYKCSIYAYCLMDNHLHDPKGFDISTFMHSLNSAYVRYYNKKYLRYGPVFQDRFESKVLSTDNYNFAVSAYIHNNPKDIEGYHGKEETYPFSSYGVYLGIRKDYYDIIDMSFLKSLFNIKNRKLFAKRYFEFVSHHRDMENIQLSEAELSSNAENEYISGRKIILRTYSPSKVIEFIANKLNLLNPGSLATKSKQFILQHRAFVAYALRVLCGLSLKQICANMYNITISCCSKLCANGYDILRNNSTYQKIFEDLITC